LQLLLSFLMEINGTLESSIQFSVKYSKFKAIFTWDLGPILAENDPGQTYGVQIYQNSKCNQVIVECFKKDNKKAAKVQVTPTQNGPSLPLLTTWLTLETKGPFLIWRALFLPW
jgi:hypothetical protein